VCVQRERISRLSGSPRGIDQKFRNNPYLEYCTSWISCRSAKSQLVLLFGRFETFTTNLKLHYATTYFWCRQILLLLLEFRGDIGIFVSNDTDFSTSASLRIELHHAVHERS